MKIKGKKIEGANECMIIIPRGNRENIVFKARAILDMEPFDLVCPRPTPPKKIMAGGNEVLNFKDAGFLAQVDNYAVKRLSWIVLSSLEATEDLEWENVDLSDPTTWNNFRKEMTEAGFSDVEINRVVEECIEVNALDELKIQEARNRFLLETQEQDEE